MRAHTKPQHGTPCFGCTDALDGQPFIVTNVGLSPHQNLGDGRHIYFVCDPRNREVYVSDYPMIGILFKQIAANIIIFSFRKDFARMVCADAQNGMLTNGCRRKRIPRKVANGHVRSFHKHILSERGFKNKIQNNSSNREGLARSRYAQDRVLNLGGDETQSKCRNPVRREVP